MMSSIWEEKALGDVVTLKRGYDLPATQRRGGSVPIVSSSGVTGHHSEAKVEPPGVVTGRYGTIGKAYYVREAFWPLNTTLYVQNFKGNDPRFVAYLLESLDLGGLIGSAAVPGINRNHLHPLRVRVPSTAVQRAVSTILGAFDDLIENNRERIDILDEMSRLMYREWFVHFRFPGHEDIELVDSDLGPIPAGWGTTSLTELADYINRGIAPKYNEASTSVVINQRCIRDHRLLLENSRRHVKKVPPEKLVRVGDVLVNSTGIGTLGRVAPVRLELDDTTVDSHVTIVRPGSTTDVDYFAELVLSLESTFESMGVGSTGQTELSRARVGETRVVAASSELQALFGEVVRPLRYLTVNLLAQNEILQQARDLLLPRLVSGELDVSELDVVLEPMG